MFARLRQTEPLAGALLAVGAALLALVLRYQVIEPEAMGEACFAGDPWWCPPRAGLIIFTEWNGFGLLSLLLAALAPITGQRPAGRWLAYPAMIAGGGGLILYNATFSAVAVVLAGLYLAVTRPAPR